MIFIIIPVYNRVHKTLNCLKSLLEQKSSNFKIIVIDDGSSDNTSSILEMQFSEIIVLKGDGNLWWTGATNMGIKYVMESLNPSIDDYILTLNNDLIVGSDYLNTLLFCARENPNAIIGSVSVDIDSPNTISFCGVSWNEYTAKYINKIKIYGSNFNLLKSKYKIISSDLLPGRGTLFPVSVFYRFGFFDSLNFPHYAADEDYSLCLKRNGYLLLICLDAVVYSHISDTGIINSNSNLERLTSIRSPVNIRTRFIWAKKNTPLPYLYFLCECSRIFYSIFIKRNIANVTK